MGKFFPASAQHAKALEFLELKQGTMTMLEYMAKLTELARFAYDYVATNIVKVRKFKNGPKLSIQGKIVRLLQQYLDSMVKRVMVIEREVDDAQSIQDASASDKRKESQLSSSSSGKKQRTSTPRGFRDRVATTKARAKARAKAKAKINHSKMGDTSGLLASQDRGHVSIATSLDK